MQYETLEQRTPTFNPQERLYHDTTTWLAEVLDGSMRTSFEYTFDGKELYAEDGSNLKEIFTGAIENAPDNPNLAFERRRREIELEEYEDMVEMAATGSNTMVVVSDFPRELNEQIEDVGGYNVERKQTMLRVIVRQEDGTISVTSQSLDKSDRQSQESIYRFFGLQPEPGELLGQRIYAEINPGRQELLADELTREYDKTLEEKYGGQYYAGRTPADMENTYHFVLSQSDLLSVFMANPDEENKLGLVAALENRWNKHQASKGKATEEIVNFGRAVLPRMEMQVLAQRAINENRTYSGCGVTLGASGTAEGELSNLGYGNKTSEETPYSFNKKMHCVVCQPKADESEPKKMCGPCGICRDCDSKL